MPKKSVQIGFVGKDEKIKTRMKSVISEFGYSIAEWDDIGALVEDEADIDLGIALAENADPAHIAENAQAIKAVSPNSFVVITVPKTLDPKSAEFLGKSGCNYILLAEEIEATGKLEFICTQILKTQYLPVKPSELTVNVPLGFDLYHLLPQRKKFLPFMFEGTELPIAKAVRIRQETETYIHRRDAKKFAEYCDKHSDGKEGAMARRCRAHFLALFSEYTELVFTLTDTGRHGSFTEGTECMNRCKELCGKLSGAIGEFGDASEIINNSGIGQFGSVERAPAVAAHVAISALQLEMDKIEEIMLCALLADLGLLFLSPEITKKIRQNKFSELTDDEKAEYQRYPDKSLAIVLDRKLQIDEKLRKQLTSTHERADQKGFPKQHYRREFRSARS